MTDLHESSGIRHFDPEGEPLDPEAWAELFERRGDEDASWWRKQTKLDEATISTVWLGLDHRLGEGPPLIWETLIFGGTHDQEMWRYSSRAVALADHDRIVTALVRGEKP